MHVIKGGSGIDKKYIKYIYLSSIYEVEEIFTDNVSRAFLVADRRGESILAAVFCKTCTGLGAEKDQISDRLLRFCASERRHCIIHFTPRIQKAKVEPLFMKRN